MSTFENNKTDTFGDNTTQQPAGSAFGTTTLGSGPSEDFGAQKMGSHGTGTLGSSDLGNTGTLGSSDEYGTQQKFGNGGTSGHDSLGSGGLGETHTPSSFGTGKTHGGLGGGTSDPYGSANDGADPALSTTAVAGDVPSTGRTDESSFGDTAAGIGGMNAGGGITGTNAGYGTQAGGAGAGYTGGEAGSDFLDTGRTSGGAHTGVGNNTSSVVGGSEHSGDSKVGKMMQKTGEVLHSTKLQQKGQQKREEKGADGANLPSSATAGDNIY
jgi:hypothetical protein